MSKIKITTNIIAPVFLFLSALAGAQGTSDTAIRNLIVALEERHDAAEESLAAAFKLMNDMHHQAMACGDVVEYNRSDSPYGFPYIAYRDSLSDKISPPDYEFHLDPKDYSVAPPQHKYFYLIESDTQQEIEDTQERLDAVNANRQASIASANAALTAKQAEQPPDPQYDEEGSSPAVDAIGYHQAKTSAWVTARKAWIENGEDTWGSSYFSLSNQLPKDPGPNPDNALRNQEALSKWQEKHDREVVQLQKELTRVSGPVVGFESNSTVVDDHADAVISWLNGRDTWYNGQKLAAANSYLSAMQAYASTMEQTLNSDVVAARAKVAYLQSVRNTSRFYPCGTEFQKAIISWKYPNPEGFDQQIVALNEISKHIDRLSSAYVSLGKLDGNGKLDVRSIALTHQDIYKPIGLVNRGNFPVKLADITERIRKMDTLKWPILVRSYSVESSVNGSSISSGAVTRNLGEMASNIAFGYPVSSSGMGLYFAGEGFLNEPKIADLATWRKDLEKTVYKSSQTNAMSRYATGTATDIASTKSILPGTLLLASRPWNSTLWSISGSIPAFDNRVTLHEFTPSPINLGGNTVSMVYDITQTGPNYVTNPNLSAFNNTIAHAQHIRDNLQYKILRNYAEPVEELGLPATINVAAEQATGNGSSFDVVVTAPLKNGVPSQQVDASLHSMTVSGESTMFFKPDFQKIPVEIHKFSAPALPAAAFTEQMKFDQFGLVFSIPSGGDSYPSAPVLTVPLSDLVGTLLYPSATYQTNNHDINGLVKNHGFWSLMKIEGSMDDVIVHTQDRPNISSVLWDENGEFVTSPIWGSNLENNVPAIKTISSSLGRIEIEWLGHYHFRLKYYYGNSTTPATTYEVSVGGVADEGQLVQAIVNYETYDEETWEPIPTGIKYPEGFEVITVKKDDVLWAKATLVSADVASTAQYSEFARVEYYDNSEQVVATQYHIDDGYEPTVSGNVSRLIVKHASGDTMESMLLRERYGTLYSRWSDFVPVSSEDWIIDHEDFSLLTMNQFTPYYGVNFSFGPDDNLVNYSEDFLDASIGEDWKHLPFFRYPKSRTYVGDEWTRNGESYQYDQAGDLLEHKYTVGGLEAKRIITPSANEASDQSYLSESVLKTDTVTYPNGVASMVHNVAGATTTTEIYLPGETHGLPWSLKSQEDALGKTTYKYAVLAGASLQVEQTFDPVGSQPNTVTTTVTSKYGELISQTTKIGTTTIETFVASEHDQNRFHKPQHIEITSGGVTKSVDITYHADGSVHTTSTSDGVNNEFVTDVLGRLAQGTKLDGQTVTPVYNGFTSGMDVGESSVTTKVDAYGRSIEQTNKVASNEFKSTRETDGSYKGQRPAEERDSTTSITSDGFLDRITSGFGQPGVKVDYAKATVGSANYLKVTSTLLNENNSLSDSWSSTYYDGYGRVVIVKSPHPSGDGTDVSTSYSYDVPNRKVTITPPSPLANVVVQYSADWMTQTVTQGTLTSEMKTVLTGTDATTTLKNNGREYYETVAGHTDRKVTTRVKGRNPVVSDTSEDGNSTTISGANGNVTVESDKDGLKKVNGKLRGKPLEFTPQRNSHGRATEYDFKPPGATGTYNFETDDSGRIDGVTGPNVNIDVNRSFPNGGEELVVTDHVNTETSAYEAGEDGSIEKTVTAGNEPLIVNGSPLDGDVTVSHASDPTRALTYEFGPTLQPISLTRADGSGVSVNLAADGSSDSYTRFSGEAMGSINYNFEMHRDGEGYLTGGFTGDQSGLSIGFTADKLPASYSYTTTDMDGQPVVHQQNNLAFFDDVPSHESYSGVLDGYQVKRLFDQTSGEPNRIEVWKSGAMVHHVNYVGLAAAPTRITATGFQLDYNYNALTGHLEGWQTGALTASRTIDTFDRLNKLTQTTATATYQSEVTQFQGSRRKVITGTMPGQAADTWTYVYDGRQLKSASSTSGQAYTYNHDPYGNRPNTGADLLNQYSTFQSAGSREYTVSGRVNPGATVKISRDGGPEEAVIVAPSGQFTQTYPLPEGHTTAERIPIEVKGTLPGAGAGGSDAVASETRHVDITPSQWAIAYGAHGVLVNDWRWAYHWSDTGLLIGQTTQAAAVTAGYPDLKLKFAYDQQGRRIRKIVEYRSGLVVTRTVTSRFVYDGWNLIAEETADSAVQGGQPQTKYYIWGLDVAESRSQTGGVGALVAIQADGFTFLPTYDLNGNVVGLVDYATGNEVAAWKRGPFGEVITANGNTDICPFGFATHYTDTETGLVYFGHRFYSPETGRWLSREPLGEMESFNLYAYCHNDPVNHVDVLGLATQLLDISPGSIFSTTDLSPRHTITYPNKSISIPFNIVYQVWKERNEAQKAQARKDYSNKVLRMWDKYELSVLASEQRLPTSEEKSEFLSRLFYNATAAGQQKRYLETYGREWNANKMGGNIHPYGEYDLKLLGAELVKAQQTVRKVELVMVAVSTLSEGALDLLLMAIDGPLPAGDTLVAARHATMAAMHTKRIGNVIDDIPITKLDELLDAAKGRSGAVDDIYVIGRLDDTLVAKDWAGHKILDIPDWTPKKNDAWVQEIIDRRAKVYLGSPQSPENLWDAVNFRQTGFGRELDQLREAGYIQVGDYMIPPGY